MKSTLRLPQHECLGLLKVDPEHILISAAKERSPSLSLRHELGPETCAEIFGTVNKISISIQ